MSSEITVEQICAMNVERARRTNSENGFHVYQSHERLFALMWGKRPASELKSVEIRAWVKEALFDFAPATIKHRLSFLSASYALAVESGLVEVNPADSVSVKKKSHRRHQWLSYEQEAALREAYNIFLPALGEFFWTAERFPILTGLRPGEQAHLRPCHITPKTLVVPDEGKTGTRNVPMHPEAYEIAQKWMQFSKKFGSDYVFWPVAGNRNLIAQRWAADVWVPCRKIVGLETYQRRDTRRTFGSRLVKAKEPLYNVMLLLGHSTMEQTRTYCQVDHDDLSPGVLNLK